MADARNTPTPAAWHTFVLRNRRLAKEDPDRALGVLKEKLGAPGTAEYDENVIAAVLLTAIVVSVKKR
jgi:hypothetical protein